MKNLKKILSVCFSIIFVIAVAITSIVFLDKKNGSGNRNGFQNQTQSQLTEKGVYFASATESTGASEAPREQKGGSVYVDEDSVIVMENGVIESHEGMFGGAIYVAKGATFTMKGGVIESNYAKFGGAIYVESGATCIIEGGFIKNNKAEQGPSIYVEHGATLLEKGGEVENNGFVKFVDTTINFHVDGSLSKKVYQNVPLFVLDRAPLDYENSCGYFFDKEMTIPVGNIDDLTKLDESNPQDENVNGVDGTYVYNLYTKEATSNILKFTLEEDVYGEYYAVSGYENKLSSNVDMVVPLKYNGIEVKKIKNDSFQSFSNLQSMQLNTNIEEIGDSAFAESGLTSICLYNSVRTIGANAFANTKLSSIVFPESISSMGDGVVKNCPINYMKTSYLTRFRHVYSGLQSVNEDVVLEFGKNVTTIPLDMFVSTNFEINIVKFEEGSILKTIEKGAFARRDLALREIYIPATLETIGREAFYDSSIISFHIPSIGSQLTTIGRACFTNSDLKTINLEALTLLTAIDEYAFAYSDIIDIELPASVQTIGEAAFSTCKSLDTVTIPENSSLTTIGGAAFISSNIKTIDFTKAKNLISIGITAFKECRELKVVNFETGVVKNLTFGGNVFENSGVQTLTFRNGMTEIPFAAFQGCVDLENVTFASIKIIRMFAFKDTKIKGTLDLSGMTSVENQAFDGCNITSVTVGSLMPRITYGCFMNCTQLSSVDFSKATSLTDIDGSAFKSTALTTVTLPQSLVKIRTGAFDKTNITSVFIPSNVTRVGRLAFGTTLQSLTFDSSNQEDWNLVVENQVGDAYTDIEYAFDVSNSTQNAASLKRQGADPVSEYDYWYYFEKSLDMPGGPLEFTLINNNTAYSVKPVSKDISGDANGELRIPAVYGGSCLPVTTIENSAFISCTALKSVVIPRSINSIGSLAFGYCSSLTKFIMKEGVTGVHKDTLFGCTNVTELSIPNSFDKSLTSGFSYASFLWYLKNLQTVTINLTTMPEIAAMNISADGQKKNIKTLILGEKVSSIANPGNFIRYNLSRLIVDENNETFISKYNCILTKDGKNLVFGCNESSIPTSVTTIGAGAFNYCTGLTSLTLPNGLTTIGDSAFANTNMERITIPTTVTTIGNNIVKNCPITSIYTAYLNNLTGVFAGIKYSDMDITLWIDWHVTSIPKAVLGYNGRLVDIIRFQEVSLLTTIGENVFEHSEIKTVILPKSLVSIGKQAFLGSSIKELQIPANTNLTTIGAECFKNSDLVNISGFEYATNLNKIDNYTFAESKIECLNMSNITEIGWGAFQGAVNFKGDENGCLDLSNVTKIDERAFTGIEMTSGVFGKGCNIKTVILGNNLEAVPYGCFMNCENLIFVYFSHESDAKLANINGSAFKNTAMEDVELPDGLIKIRTGAFDQTNITEVYIPSSVRRVGRYAFGSTIESISFADAEGWNLVVENAEGTAYTNIVYNIDVSNDFNNALNLKLRGENPVNEYDFWYYFEKDLDMPGPFVFTYSEFNGAYNISAASTSVTGKVIIPDTYNGKPVTVITNSAFKDCVEITEVEINDRVEVIETAAFQGCTALTKVTIGKSVREIYPNAFAGCNNLTSIIVESVSESVDNWWWTNVDVVGGGSYGPYDFKDAGSEVIARFLVIEFYNVVWTRYDPSLQ